MLIKGRALLLKATIKIVLVGKLSWCHWDNRLKAVFLKNINAAWGLLETMLLMNFLIF